MAKKDDVHWVLTYGGKEITCEQYSSRRCAIRGARRKAEVWTFVDVVAEDGDTLELHESFAHGFQMDCPIEADGKETLRKWNAYWKARGIT